MTIDIDRLADEHGSYAIVSGDEPFGVVRIFTDDELTAYTRAVMEACAAACTQVDENGDDPDSCRWHAKDYAAAIREMMP